MKPQDRTRAVLRSGLKSLEKLLAIAICDYMSTHDEAWPSIPTLAEDTGMGRRTILRTLKALEGRGLTAERSRGKATRYALQVADLPQRDPCQSGTPVVPERHGCQSGTGARSAPPPVPERHPRGARAAPEA